MHFFEGKRISPGASKTARALAIRDHRGYCLNQYIFPHAAQLWSSDASLVCTDLGYLDGWRCGSGAVRADTGGRQAVH